MSLLPTLPHYTAVMFRICRLLLIFSAVPAAHSRTIPELVSPTQYTSQRWTTTEGLPESKLYGVAQTPDDFLWCVTRHHLVRFDGQKFETAADLESTPELKGLAFFRNVAVDARGLLWVLAEHGAACWTGRQWLVFEGRLFFSLLWSDGDRNWFDTQRGLVLVENDRARIFPISRSILMSEKTSASGQVPIDCWLARESGLYRFQNGHYLLKPFRSEAGATAIFRPGRSDFGWAAGIKSRGVEPVAGIRCLRSNSLKTTISSVFTKAAMEKGSFCPARESEIMPTCSR